MVEEQTRTASRLVWTTIAVFLLSVSIGLYSGLFCRGCKYSPPSVSVGAGRMELVLLNEEDAEPGCLVHPRFIDAVELDNVPVNETLPDHVYEFDKKGYRLPFYSRQDLYVVSFTSRVTYSRHIAQRYTFGRIYDVKHVWYDKFPLCVLCDEQYEVDACHCPDYRKDCGYAITYSRSEGWWCNNKREVAVITEAFEDWEGEFPNWLHAVEDNTFINPVSMQLFLQELDPDKPYFIGDDVKGALVGGPGKLISRGLLKLLLGPPVNPVVTYHWPNGTYSARAKTQIESCVMRMQGGDWCYFHGDWGLSQCVYELGIEGINIGGYRTCSFFNQMQSWCRDKDSRPFGLEKNEVSQKLIRSHQISAHTTDDEMFDVFYNVVVPYYNRLVTN